MATVSIAPKLPILELGSQLLALAVGIFGYVLLTERTKPRLANLDPQIGVLIALAIIGEVGIHSWHPTRTPSSRRSRVALTGLGLAMIYRLDLSYAKTTRPVGYAGVSGASRSSSPLSS